MAGYLCLSGGIQLTRIGVQALGLVPLRLEEMDMEIREGEKRLCNELRF